MGRHKGDTRFGDLWESGETLAVKFSAPTSSWCPSRLRTAEKAPPSSDDRPTSRRGGERDALPRPSCDRLGAGPTDGCPTPSSGATASPTSAAASPASTSSPPSSAGPAEPIPGGRCGYLRPRLCRCRHLRRRRCLSRCRARTSLLPPPTRRRDRPPTAADAPALQLVRHGLNRTSLSARTRHGIFGAMVVGALAHSLHIMLAEGGK